MSFPSMGGYFMPSDPKERAREARDTFETMYWWNPSMEGTSATMKQMEETGDWKLGMEGFGAPVYVVNWYFKNPPPMGDGKSDFGSLDQAMAFFNDKASKAPSNVSMVEIVADGKTLKRWRPGSGFVDMSGDKSGDKKNDDKSTNSQPSSSPMIMVAVGIIAVAGIVGFIAYGRSKK